MPQTIETLIVVAIAIVPGAAYRLAFESIVGPWGTTLSDRVVRFIVYSAILHALFSVPTYMFWSAFLANGQLVNPGVAVSPSVGLVPLGYVLLPATFGLIHGVLAKNNKSLLPDPHPTAREYLFGYQRRGWIRIRLIDGHWIAGFYGLSSTTGLKGYASSYAEADADILLSEIADVDPDTGEWLLNPDDTLSVTERSLLVPWRQVSQLEFEPV